MTGLWTHRSFVVRSAWAELRHRYAGSAMGVVWNLLHPLLLIAVFTIVFSSLMPVRLAALPGRTAFAVYLCVGLLPWTAFADSVQRGANALLEHASYLKRLPIPSYLFVAQSTLVATLSLGISMSLLFAFLLAVGHPPVRSWALVPLVLVAFQLFAFGLALLLAPLNVLVHDIGQLLGVVLQVWFWLTPIVYLPAALPPGVVWWLTLNPTYHYVAALHELIIDNAWPAPGTWIAVAAWSMLSPLAGWVVFSRLRRDVRDAL